MSFDYNQIRARQQASGTQWASYSDLFMVLAFIFLLMYMVSSLRTGMISVTSHAEIQEVRQELEIYETIKDQYLSEQTNALEKKIYSEIIEQIALLEDEASAKKKKLTQQAEQEAERQQQHTDTGGHAKKDQYGQIIFKHGVWRARCHPSGLAEPLHCISPADADNSPSAIANRSFS